MGAGQDPEAGAADGGEKRMAHSSSSGPLPPSEPPHLRGQDPAQYQYGTFHPPPPPARRLPPACPARRLPPACPARRLPPACPAPRLLRRRLPAAEAALRARRPVLLPGVPDRPKHRSQEKGMEIHRDRTEQAVKRRAQIAVLVELRPDRPWRDRAVEEGGRVGL
uniref:Predicted protein n=1 Tax=Hordeum vulgare subsp. vulgare TaxID=112509 RepID=F2EEK3_HORVV|nr:predicted protein [Hordeum vulgare subsp. vulgare]